MWTQELVDSVLVMHRAGLSASEISKKTGITRNAIIGKLNRIKAGRGNYTRVKWTPERVEELSRLCARGMTINEMADKMGLHYRQVRDCIKYRNLAWVKTRKSPAPSAVDVFLPYPAWKKWNRERRAERAERV